MDRAVAITYGDLREDEHYELDVRVREVTKPAIEKREFELSVEDRIRTRVQCIVWTASEAGRNYDCEGGVVPTQWCAWKRVAVGRTPSRTSKLEVQRLEEPPDGSRSEVVYLTDSNLGKTRHTFNGESRAVNPAEGFQRALEYAIEADADTVVHGGDLFHNPGSGIWPREKRSTTIWSELNPFYSRDNDSYIRMTKEAKDFVRESRI